MSNPFVKELISMLTDVKGWVLAAVGIVTAVVIAIDGLKYQPASSSEKEEIVRSIRKKLIMGGGIFFLVWLAIYITERFAKVA